MKNREVLGVCISGQISSDVIAQTIPPLGSEKIGR